MTLQELKKKLSHITKHGELSRGCVVIGDFNINPLTLSTHLPV